MRTKVVDQAPKTFKKPYVAPKLVFLGNVGEIPSLNGVFVKEKAKREMRKAQTDNSKKLS